ncbi:hypothetical protein HDU97_004802 [Phlyctochytrium planicorne]|nr:hypothetical protein HDU97_004802 [Phlyctochytrium planicorne]
MGGSCTKLQNNVRPGTARDLAGLNPPTKPITADEILTHPELLQLYEMAPPYKSKLEGRGEASITATVKRKADGRIFVLKKVVKSKLPSSQWYIKPCTSGKKNCNCQTCKGDKDHKMLPMELVLMRSRGSGAFMLCRSEAFLFGISLAVDDFLPELVAVFEDLDCFYYITAVHGVRRRRLKALKTWFKPKYYPCYWNDYMRV